MKYRYFKLNEEDSRNYNKMYRDKVGKPRGQLLVDFLAEHNAEGYRYNESFGYTRISALIVRGNANHGRNKHVPIDGECESGRFYVTPDRRYLEGRQLSGSINAMNKRLESFPSFSRWVVDMFSCYAEAFGNRSGQEYITYTSAGFYPERPALIVRIPTGMKGNNPLPDDISPALIEIKHSEFIAITEE